MAIDLPDDFEGAEKVAKFEDNAALAKGYIELQKKLGSAIPAPTSDESRDALFDRLGAKSEASAYEVPSGVDEALVKDLREYAVKAKLTPEQFARLAQETQDKAAADYAATQAARETGGERVVKEFGENFPQAQAHVTLALESMGIEAASKFDLKDPAVFKALASMGAAQPQPNQRVAPIAGNTGEPTFDAAVVANEARRILESDAYNDRNHRGHSEAKQEYGQRLAKLISDGRSGCYDPALMPKTGEWGV